MRKEKLKRAQWCPGVDVGPVWLKGLFDEVIVSTGERGWAETAVKLL